jgi:hypothetical protein
MNPEVRSVSAHMRELGLGSMQHAMRLSLYDGGDNRWWGELSVLQAAHAAEILIKARIAAEHPLLVFDQLPRPAPGRLDRLDVGDLFEKARTVQYAELPERLWATTGIRIPRADLFLDFGRLRNMIQHFAAPDAHLRQRTLEFIVNVLDPFIGEQWGLFAIDYNEEYGDHYEHIFETLVRRNLRLRVSPHAADVWTRLKYVPGKNAPKGYKKWFRKAMATASTTPPSAHGDLGG